MPNSILTNRPKSVLLWLSILFISAPILVLAQTEADASEEIKNAIRTGTLQKGVYATFADFVANQPSIVDSFYVSKVPRDKEVWAGTFSLTPRYASSYKKVKKVWGFSDGEKAYIFNDIEFFELELEGDQLIFYGYGKQAESGGPYLGVSGGAIGGAIGAGVSYTIVVSKSKSERVKYTVNSGGSGVHPEDEALAWRAVYTKELVIYRRSKKEAPESVSFMVSDSMIYTFPPDSYVQLWFREDDESVKICSGSNFQNCSELPLDKEKMTYVKCSLAPESNAASFLIVEDDEGNFDWAKVEKIQDKRGPQVPVIIDQN